jgi:hypothetical protein
MSANSDFGTWGRYKEIPLDKMTPDQKRIYLLTKKERGQVPGPYKIWLQNPKLMEVMKANVSKRARTPSRDPRRRLEARVERRCGVGYAVSESRPRPERHVPDCAKGAPRRRQLCRADLARRPRCRRRAPTGARMADGREYGLLPRGPEA